MVSKKTLLTAFSLLLCFLAGCNSNKSGCTPPPISFTEVDLIGEWVAGWPDRQDTLIIREDGTYKQIVHINYIDIPDVNYESDWLEWNLEYSEKNFPYLHLESMSLCGYIPDLKSCDQNGGGNADWDAFNENYYHDFCQDEFILMENEGILMVLGSPDGPTHSSPPRGIRLFIPSISPEGAWAYTLVNP
jgi:hypothetical protein